MIGDQIHATPFVSESLTTVLLDIIKNANINPNRILDSIINLGFPFSNNVVEKQMVHMLNRGLIRQNKFAQAYGIRLP